MSMSDVIARTQVSVLSDLVVSDERSATVSRMRALIIAAALPSSTVEPDRDDPRHIAATSRPAMRGHVRRARFAAPRRRVLRSTPLVAAMLFVSGSSLACRAVSSPDVAGSPSGAGIWALQSIGTTPLPLVTSVGGHGSDTLVGDTLVFAPDGTATSATYVYVVFAYPGLPSRNDTTAIRSTGTWRQQGAVVASVWHLPGTSDTVLQTATLTSAGRLASAGGIGYRYGSTAVAGAPTPAYVWTRTR